MSSIMDALSLILLATWVGTLIGLGVLVLVRVANLIVRELING